MPFVDPYAGAYQDHFVNVNNLRLHYTTWGDPNSHRTVLMIHGLNVQLHTWDPIASRLSSTSRVILLDLRGHGDSQWATSGYAVDKFVSDVHEFTRALDLPPVIFVGHSLGSRIGIAYGAEHPDEVAALVLSDTGPEVPRKGAKNTQSTIGSTGEVKGFRNEEEAHTHYNKMYPEWQPIFLDLHVRYQLRRNWAGKLVFKADPDLFWITGSASLREVPYLWDAASRVAAPTLIIRGARSHLLDEEITNKMLEVIPHSEAAVLDTTHYVPREATDEFIALVDRFIAQHVGGNSTSERDRS